MARLLWLKGCAMKKILVATHGRLASGVKSVAEVLLHDGSAITVVDCYVDESDPNEQIAEFIDGVRPEDDALIVTDLLGGSVCNMVTAMQPEKHGIVHVTGFNIALILECLITGEAFTPEYIDSVIAQASTSMRRVVLRAGGATDTDDDFFG